ncbi:unnamed protein product [Protopolystoma xenopodis]|uniref:Uncharacterized protein n=1 Tax=Protopolystoma xenopodis TaxID=117903 RepID=A0A3S5B9U9_9PLAT|nr:unnamed protein product [Protopolystoma xenopodis]
MGEFLPASKKNRCLLDSSIYELVLSNFIDSSPSEFLRLINKWSATPGLFSIEAVIQVLSDRIDRYGSLSSQANTDILTLWRALATLYEQAGITDKSLDVLIRLHDPSIFDTLERHVPIRDRRILQVLRDRVLDLHELNTSKALLLYLEILDDIPVATVVSKLSQSPYLQFKYLDMIYVRYPYLVTPHLSRLIELYAIYQRDKLLPLLRFTDQYPLSEALELCNSAKFVPETVYLLTRVGRRTDALKLIMTQVITQF